MLERLRAALAVALLTPLALAACTDSRPSSGTHAAAAAGPLPVATNSIDLSCAAYRRALDLATPYARTGSLTGQQNSAIANAIQEAGPVCMAPRPDPRAKPMVDASLAGLAASGIPIR